MAAARALLCFTCLLIVSVASQKASDDDLDFNCPDRTGFFPDPEQCDLYYKCSKGRSETKICPDGLVFSDNNPNHERCDIPSNVDCGDRTILQEPRPSKGCPRANGYFRHSDPLICDKFFNCVDGIPNELPCPPGLIYDDVAATCDWPQSTKRTDCLVTKKEVLSDGFSCPDGETMGPNDRPLPHPTFPHPNDCQKFYICREGVRPSLGSCGPGEVYNEDSFRCTDPDNVPGCEDFFGDSPKGKKA